MVYGKYFLAWLLLGVLWLGGMTAEAREEVPVGTIQDIGVKDAAERVKRGDVTVVDVRTPGEFREGHLDGARNVNLFGTRFEDEVASLPRDKPVLVYCRSGRRSAEVADILKKEGHQVLHMHEGVAGWQKARLPLRQN